MVTLSFATGLGFACALRYIGDIPFPWKWDKRNPKVDEYDFLVKPLQKLKDGYKLNAVVNAKAYPNRVLEALEDALKKDVEINLILGPSYDKRLLELLNNPKVRLSMLVLYMCHILHGL